MRECWDGFGEVEDNVITTDVLFPWSCEFPLSETPNVPTSLPLPAQTRAVVILTMEEPIRIFFDDDPQPPGTFSGTMGSSTAFTRGDTVIPGIKHKYAIIDDGEIHELRLSSSAVSPVVHVTALREGVP